MRALERVDRRARELRAKRDAQILALRRGGLSLERIGERVGLTRQRVSIILMRMRREVGEQPGPR